MRVPQLQQHAQTPGAYKAPAWHTNAHTDIGQMQCMYSPSLLCSCLTPFPAPPPQLATQVVGSLLALEAMDEEEEIRVYINSPGGQPYSIIGVVDTMQVGTTASSCYIRLWAFGREVVGARCMDLLGRRAGG